MKWITKFAASKVSGYALIALIIAGAGAGYWFWSELKEFGGLEQRAQSQAETIAVQEARLLQLIKLSYDRQAALTGQLQRTQELERNARMYRLAIQEAKRNADKATRDCMAMHLPDSLQFGPIEDADSHDKARSDMDG